MKDLIDRREAIDAINGVLVEDDACKVWFRLALQNLPSEQPEQRWIPCSERLPKYGEAVLTVNEDEDYEINHVIDEDNGEWFFDDAIAWMPLPEPYKEDDK